MKMIESKDTANMPMVIFLKLAKYWKQKKTMKIAMQAPSKY